MVATVRRPASSIYDKIGLSDMTTDNTYFERGINLLHGFLTEYDVEWTPMQEFYDPLKQFGSLKYGHIQA